MPHFVFAFRPFFFILFQPPSDSASSTMVNKIDKTVLANVLIMRYFKLLVFNEVYRDS